MSLSRISNLTILNACGDEGLYFSVGPFIVCLHTSIPSVIEGVALLYGDYPIAETSAFADYHITLQATAGVRRWYRPQVNFLFDGYKPFKPLPLSQSMPSFEWGLNWCIANNAHQYLIIHAAVVEKNGRAVILPAPPGSGKSTLCAALVNRGWRLFSDELALISMKNGNLVPIPRPVNLKNDSIEIIKSFAPDAVFSQKVRDTNKGTVSLMKAPGESAQRSTEVARAAWVVFPRYLAGADATLTSKPKAQACMALAQNAFNYNVLGAQGFKVLSSVVDASDCYEFGYSQLDEAIEVFDGLAASV